MSQKQKKKIRYEDPVGFSIEIALDQIELLLETDYTLSKRAIALLLIQEDEEIEQLVEKQEPGILEKIKQLVSETKKHYSHPLNYIIAMRRQEEVSDIVQQVTHDSGAKGSGISAVLSQLTMHPVTGLPILLFVLYWGLYKFVGEFGSGTLVDFLENTVFEGYINPFVTDLFTKIIPWHVIQELVIGEYGLITLGVRYAVAIILPIVAIFFLFFSIIEDTGYLPRLAMLIDRVFKKIGLSGRAVIPMVLGFGCTTMATMVTRTLPTKRERLIATILLALAVPCSAQIGVIIAMMEGHKAGLFVWAGVISLVFLFIGYLAAKVLPGERPTFYMEVPPLRLPKISNVIVKTYSRVKWYFKEILPLFLLASFMIWLGKLTGLFNVCIWLLKWPVDLIGLPPEAAKVFLFGFFRRDYGAAGLYDLSNEGILTGVQLVVACVTLTLFLPCIAQLLMNIKERGIKTGIAISVFVLVFSFGLAYVLNLILVATGVTL